MSDGKVDSSSFCAICNYTAVTSVGHIRKEYERHMPPGGKNMLHSLVVTDCSNCFSSIHNVSVRCQDKNARLAMYYIRDCQRDTAISYVCGPLNMADVGAKSSGNIVIYRSSDATGLFELAFLTRKEVRLLLEGRHRMKRETDKGPLIENGRKRIRLNFAYLRR